MSSRVKQGNTLQGIHASVQRDTAVAEHDINVTSIAIVHFMCDRMGNENMLPLPCFIRRCSRLLDFVTVSLPGPYTPEMSEDWRRGCPEEEGKPSILPSNYARVVEY